jgi:hypothetical protein
VFLKEHKLFIFINEEIKLAFHTKEEQHNTQEEKFLFHSEE